MAHPKGWITLQVRVGSQEEFDRLMEVINEEEEECRIENVSVEETDRDLNTPNRKP